MECKWRQDSVSELKTQKKQIPASGRGLRQQKIFSNWLLLCQVNVGAGEKAQPLKALANVAEDLDSVLSTHIEAHNCL